MKKENLKHIAMMGLAGGLLFSASQAEGVGSQQLDPYPRHGCGGGNACGGSDDGKGGKRAQGTTGHEVAYYTPEGEISEKALLSQLSEESKQIYLGFDESEKQLVLRLAKQFQDKNAAVRQVQRQKLQENSKDSAEHAHRSVTRLGLFR